MTTPAFLIEHLAITKAPLSATQRKDVLCPIFSTDELAAANERPAFNCLLTASVPILAEAFRTLPPGHVLAYANNVLNDIFKNKSSQSIIRDALTEAYNDNPDKPFWIKSLKKTDFEALFNTLYVWTVYRDPEMKHLGDTDAFDRFQKTRGKEILPAMDALPENAFELFMKSAKEDTFPKIEEIIHKKAYAGLLDFLKQHPDIDTVYGIVDAENLSFLDTHDTIKNSGRRTIILDVPTAPPVAETDADKTKASFRKGMKGLLSRKAKAASEETTQDLKTRQVRVELFGGPFGDMNRYFRLKETYLHENPDAQDAAYYGFETVSCGLGLEMDLR